MTRRLCALFRVGNRANGSGEADKFLVGELVEAVAAELASDAGVLDAAEGEVGRALDGGVEADHADVEPPAAAMAPGVGPLAIGAAAMGIGGLLQAAAARRVMFTHRGALTAQWRTVLASAGAVAVFPLAFYYSMRLAGVAVGTVVSIGSAPPAAAVIERIVDHQPLSRGWALGTTVGVSGVLALALAHPGQAGTATMTTTARPVLGIALGLLAGFTYALYSWGAVRVMRCGLPSRPVIGAFFGLGGILLLPVLALTGAPIITSGSNLAVAAYLAIVPSSWVTSSSGVDWPPSRRAPQPRCPFSSPPWPRSWPSSCWANTCRPSDGSAWGCSSPASSSRRPTLAPQPPVALATNRPAPRTVPCP